MRGASILYRAHRLRFILVLLFLLPFTVLMAALAYDGLVLGDKDVNGAWATPFIGALFIWFDYIVIVKLFRPPELEVTPRGIRWANYSMLEPSTWYDWNDIEGPEQSAGTNGISLLQIVVKSTGKKLRMPPSHFGATYEEMAAIIAAARAGRLISPDEWRSAHPQHPVRRWLIDWGLPLSLGVALGIGLVWLKH